MAAGLTVMMAAGLTVMMAGGLAVIMATLMAVVIVVIATLVVSYCTSSKQCKIEFTEHFLDEFILYYVSLIA